MDDLSAHFYVTIGQSLDQAAVGRLRVRLELADAGVVEGGAVWIGRHREPELDDSGYPRAMPVEGRVVAWPDTRC